MSGKRNRRAGVEDRWTKTVRDPDGTTRTEQSASYGKGSRWRARYVDERGREHAKAFTRKADATRWLDRQTAAIVSGTHVAPRMPSSPCNSGATCGSRVTNSTTNPRCGQRAPISRQIVTEFGDMPLSAVRPSQVKAWVAKLQRRT